MAIELHSARTMLAGIMHPSPSVLFLAAMAVVTALFQTACFSRMGPARQQTDRSSSVVSYLYPGEVNPLPPTDIPVLRLPLRIGIAFVPSGEPNRPARSGGMSEVQKNLLMERVAAEFRTKEYIQSIEVVPSTYMRAGGGFANLQQVGNLLGFDVVALVAYDQVQFSNENLLSLTYWTIVGSYIFSGNKNETETMMETAVYDIASRNLLFRAPGINSTQGSSTAVDLNAELGRDSNQSFAQATDHLVVNLQSQLELFRERIKTAPESVRIEHRPGYSGSGSMNGWMAAGLVGLILLRRLWPRAAGV